MPRCPNCGEGDDFALVLIADLIIDKESGRPYAMYRYRCGNCDEEFDEDQKWWE